MRWLILLVLLASLAPIAGASKRVTVTQLEQALTAAHAAHRPDAEIARQIGGLELSERLTEATLNRLAAYLDAGSQAGWLCNCLPISRLFWTRRRASSRPRQLPTTQLSSG